MKNHYLFVALLSVVWSNLLIAQDTLWTRIGQPDSLQVNGVAFSADGTQVLSGTNCHPAHLRLFATSTGALNWDYEVPMSLQCMMGVGFSSNGNYLAAVEESGNVMVFDYSQSPPDSVTTIDMGTLYAFSLSFAPNNVKMAAGGSSGKLQTYFLSTGAVDLNITAHAGYTNAVAYSPDNLKLVSGGTDNKVKVWDTLGTLLHTFTNHTDDVTAVQFTPDNLRIVSAGNDNTIRIYDAVNYALLQTITVSSADVSSLSISPDGSYVVTGSSDGRVRIFSLSTYQLVAMLPYASGAVYAVAWSPLGDKVVSGTGQGKVVLYDVSLVSGLSETEAPTTVAAWPNPFMHQLFVTSTATDIQQLTLTDLQGRLVHTQPAQPGTLVHTLQTSALPAGTYLLTLTTRSGNQFVQRVIHN